MASKLTNEEGSSQTKKNLDRCKFPKIPINQVYKKKAFSLFPSYVSYAVKDFEETITLKADNQNVAVKLLSRDFLKDFIEKQHSYLHLGLVQVAIKPLIRDGLGSPITVCLRDNSCLNFRQSVVALVEANLSEGPFYFNCFPSYSVSLSDVFSFGVLTLDIKTGGIPLALTYRLVCKAMVNLCPRALKEQVSDETPFFRPATGTQSTTYWDEVQLPESWTRERKPKAKNSVNVFGNLPDGVSS